MIDRTIVPENIGALGAIYFASMVEELEFFDVADRLVELYLNGQLPIGRSETRSLLDAYGRNAGARMSSAQRRDIYARAFGVRGGDGESLQNREFNELWMRFVSSVAALAKQRAVDPVLRDSHPPTIGQEQVRKAGRDLAVNVSLHGFGLAGLAGELARHVEDARKLLADPDIRQAYGARDAWQLVERVSSRELGGVKPGIHRIAMAQSGALVIAWLASRTSALTAAAGDALDLSDIRNKRRSDRPTQPTDYELVNACEQWLAASAVAASQVETFSHPGETPAAQRAVRGFLSNSAAFSRLSPAMQARVAGDMSRIADVLAPRETSAGFAALVDDVNFPDFVADLIHGVFQAIVDASIEQMNAYADLLAAVAASLEKFRDANISDARLRDHLCQHFPALCNPPRPGDEASIRRLDTVAGGTWRRLATSRQQLLATMIVMGVNRIAEDS